MIELFSTPIELHNGIYVKREDLSTPHPGPSFSKIRGLIPVLERLKKEGYKTIGYTETSVSMAGWGVAWACQELGLKAVIFDPQYKVTPNILQYHREQWYKFDATIVPIKAGMAKVNWNISKTLIKNFEKPYLLPLGLPFKETIDGAEAEVKRTRANSEVDFSTIVVNVGSGTVCAGVIKGFHDKHIIGIMGRTGNAEQKKKKILDKAGFQENSLFSCPKFDLYDPGWEYTEKSQESCPFPCHPWYDLKAWEWLMNYEEYLKEPVLFWNIGSLPNEFKERGLL